MGVTPDDPPSMIDNWRRLAALYRRSGNIDAATRADRLADQLAQMVTDATLSYSPEPTKKDTVHTEGVHRVCRTCRKVLPLADYRLTRTPDVCKDCAKPAPPPPAKVRKTRAKAVKADKGKAEWIDVTKPKTDR